MATLTVWKFDTPDGAARAEEVLAGLSEAELIEIHDAATVEWQPGKKKPTTRQATRLAGVGAVGGAFWGLLFGLLFFVPLLGRVVGAAVGSIAGSLADAGIDEGFVDAVKAQVTPGTSALFLLSSDAVLDKVSEAFAAEHPHLIRTNLSHEQENQLRAAFAAED